MAVLSVLSPRLGWENELLIHLWYVGYLIEFPTYGTDSHVHSRCIDVRSHSLLMIMALY